MTPTAAVSEIVAILCCVYPHSAPLRWGHLTNLHMESWDLGLNSHLDSGLWWSSRLSFPEAQPCGSAAVETYRPTAVDAPHCLGALRQAEARWLEAVLLGGAFLPYPSSMLKSAAIPDSTSIGSKGWRAFTEKISSRTVCKSFSATDVWSLRSLCYSPCCRKYRAGFCFAAMNFTSVERFRPVSCQPEAQIRVYQSMVILRGNPFLILSKTNRLIFLADSRKVDCSKGIWLVNPMQTCSAGLWYWVLQSCIFAVVQPSGPFVCVKHS